MPGFALILESWGQGGTESYVEGLVKLLIANDYDVFIFVLSPGEELSIDFLPRERVISARAWELPKKIRKHRIGYINLHLYSSLLMVTIISKLLGLSVITTLHMPLNSWGSRHRAYWRIAIRLADKVVGVSRLVLKQVNVKALYPEPVPGGVYSDFFQVERKCRFGGNNGESHRIFAVGRLSKEKDWPTLVRAVSLMPEKYREKIVIDFFGDGALSEDLNKLAEGLGVSVIMHGFVDKKQLGIEFEDAEISVLPSRFEGFGLAAIESMAAGVPTITSDFEASKDFIVEGATGYRFPAGDAEALSRLLLEIIEDPFEAEKIAFQGREFVRERFSEDKTYLPYLKLFNHKK